MKQAPAIGGQGAYCLCVVRLGLPAERGASKREVALGLKSEGFLPPLTHGESPAWISLLS